MRRLYEALDLTDPQPPTHPRQLAYYDDGVGTSGFRPLAVLGGAFGYGLARNVRDVYAFLCRTYRPGDRIYGFGFSRGAFTMRVVAGLILRQGIVPYDGDEAALQRNVADAYREYRRERFGNAPLPARAGRALRDGVIALWRRARGHAPYDPMRNAGGPREPEDGKITIEMLGVWDTVDAYGLPIEELTRAIDRYIWPLSFPDAEFNPRVRRGCQALALDEERNTFQPRLWNEATERPERINQVWFAGVHADVGGGYADDSLAHVSLNWMSEQAEMAGLRFSGAIRAQQRALADDNGPVHDSRRGLGGYYRYKPRDVATLTNRTGDDGPRVVIPRPRIHHSVFRRIRDGQDGYVPLGLPPRFDVSIPVPRTPGGPPQPDRSEEGDAFLGLGVDGRRRLDARQDDVRNLVLLRRLAYAVTLAGTFALVLTPLFLRTEGCSSWGCFLSPLIVGAGHVLPGFASIWVATLAANPLTALILAAVVWLGLAWGSSLKLRIADAMRHAWYGLVPNWVPPLPAGRHPEPRSPGLPDRIIGALRHSPALAAVRVALTRRVMPAVFLTAAGLLVVCGASSALVAAWESYGGLCVADRTGQAPEAGAAFDTKSLCHDVRHQAVEGATYRLRVTVLPGPQAPPGTRGWLDSTIEASPNGVQTGARSFLEAVMMDVATPVRRHVGEPWFKLMARIGERGSDVYAPDWRLVRRDVEHDVFEADLAARRSGPLFLYVNDALPVVGQRLFYRNNQGLARVQVELRSRTHPGP